MFVHIFKMIWHRKRSNALIIAEVAIAFMVIFALTALSIKNYTLYNTPLGFSYSNMWRVSLDNFASWNAETDQATVKQLLNVLKQQPEIEAAELMNAPAFKDWRWTSSYETDGKKLYFMANQITDGMPKLMELELVDGRWFGPEDDGQNYKPTLVNQLFVDTYFPGEDVVGKNITEDGKQEGGEVRIVGVYKSFRQTGELSTPSPYLFHRYNLNKPSQLPLSGIEVKLKPGTPIIYQEQLTKIIKGVAPQWEAEISAWHDSRDTILKESLIPLIVLSIVGCFLIVMVAMGLFGVLWQNVTSRTQEIGLRRAIGATASQIHKQIISELLVVSALGIAIAFIVLIQLPILGVFEGLTWTLFLQGFVVSTAVMLVLASLCAFYPGQVATNYTPAEALHYE